MLQKQPMLGHPKWKIRTWKGDGDTYVRGTTTRRTTWTLTAAVHLGLNISDLRELRLNWCAPLSVTLSHLHLTIAWGCIMMYCPDEESLFPPQHTSLSCDTTTIFMWHWPIMVDGTLHSGTQMGWKTAGFQSGNRCLRSGGWRLVEFYPFYLSREFTVSMLLF